MEPKLHIYWHISSWSGDYLLFFWKYGLHYLLHTILRIFSEYSLDKDFIRCCWAAAATFIFQIKIANSKSLKPIADDRNSCTISVNSRNLVCNIICTIYTSFLKQWNIRCYKCFLWLFILNSVEKSFKRDCINET